MGGMHELYHVSLCVNWDVWSMDNIKALSPFFFCTSYETNPPPLNVSPLAEKQPMMAVTRQAESL